MNTLHTQGAAKSGIQAALRVLVACEFSGAVSKAFAAKGCYAVSCDLLPGEQAGVFHSRSFGDMPKHHQGNVLDILNDGWDLMIAHPPCTYLCTMSNCRIKEPGRIEKRERAMEFFMALANAPIERIAIENPRGYPERAWRKAMGEFVKRKSKPILTKNQAQQFVRLCLILRDRASSETVGTIMAFLLQGKHQSEVLK